MPDNENPADDGYLVVNSGVSERNVDGFDGYVSWLPKLAFDEQYKPNKEQIQELEQKISEIITYCKKDGFYDQRKVAMANSQFEIALLLLKDADNRK